MIKAVELIPANMYARTHTGDLSMSDAKRLVVGLPVDYANLVVCLRSFARPYSQYFASKDCNVHLLAVEKFVFLAVEGTNCNRQIGFFKAYVAHLCMHVVVLI